MCSTAEDTCAASNGRLAGMETPDGSAAGGTVDVMPSGDMGGRGSCALLGPRAA